MYNRKHAYALKLNIESSKDDGKYLTYGFSTKKEPPSTS